jgi:hypothetical protein
MLDYKIVVVLLFPNGDEEYVIWEPVFFGDMLDRGVDLNTLFYSSPELVKSEPLEVNIFLYSNPSLTTTKYGQLLVGKRICLIRTI